MKIRKYGNLSAILGAVTTPTTGNNASTNSLGNNAYLGRFKLGLGISTGFNDINTAKAQGLLSVYPNPAYNILNIVLPDQVSGSLTITLINISGQIMQSDDFVVSNGTVQIDTKELSSGIYIIKAQGATFSGVSKFVKSE